jgi:electron transfer flavoprotein alpha subunit
MDFSFLDDWVDEESVEPPMGGGEGYRNIWVLAETENGELPPATLETMGQARELADQIGCYVFALLLGAGVQALAASLIAYGADKVLVADDPALAEYQPQDHTRIISGLVTEYRPEILFLPATLLGSDLAPRLAQALETGLISNCVKLDLDMSERLLLGTCPMYGGEMFNTVACPQARPQMATLKPGFFPVPYEDTFRSGETVVLKVGPSGSDRLSWLSMDTALDQPAVVLQKAKVVVSAGRGMRDAEGFELVERLAAALGGVVAGSRGAFDEGWIEESQIIGVGGKTIAPDLCIACGLSGDIFHYFAMQQAKFVVAINSDTNAPIMKVANMALVGDAKQIVPAMLEALGC